MLHDRLAFSPNLGYIGMSVRFNQDKKQKDVRTTSVDPQLQPGFNQLAGAATGGIGVDTSFPGTRVAPLTGAQQGALDLSGFADSFGAFQDSPLFGEAGRSLQGRLSGEGFSQQITPEQANQMFESIFGAPGRKEFNRTVKPAVREEFSGPGFFGSSRARAGVEAAGDFEDRLAQRRAQFGRDIFDFNAQLDRDRSSREATASSQVAGHLGLPTTLDRQSLAGRADLFGFAGAEQRQQQNVINAEIQKFAEQFDIATPQALDALKFLLSLGTGSVTDTSVQRASEFDEAKPFIKGGSALLGGL